MTDHVSHLSDNAGKKKALADASGRFDAADVTKIHYLGFADLTQFGRLTAFEVNEVCPVVSHTPESKPRLHLGIIDPQSCFGAFVFDFCSHCFVLFCICCERHGVPVCPSVLAGDGVIGGIRGEIRQV